MGKEMASVSVHVLVGSGVGIEIKYNQHSKKVGIVSNLQPGEKIPDELLSLANLNANALNALRGGVTLDRYYAPFSVANKTPGRPAFKDPSDTGERYFKAKWTRAGKLKPLGVVKTKFKHIEKPDDALERKGVFTCDFDLIGLLPVVKEQTQSVTEEGSTESVNVSASDIEDVNSVKENGDGQ